MDWTEASYSASPAHGTTELKQVNGGKGKIHPFDATRMQSDFYNFCASFCYNMTKFQYLTILSIIQARIESTLISMLVKWCHVQLQFKTTRTRIKHRCLKLQLFDYRPGALSNRLPSHE